MIITKFSGEITQFLGWVLKKGLRKVISELRIQLSCTDMHAEFGPNDHRDDAPHCILVNKPLKAEITLRGHS